MMASTPLNDAPSTDNANAPDASAAPAKRNHTAGEISFDLLVYAGIGWVLNTAISVFAADRFRNGTWKSLNVKGEQFFNGLYKPFIHNEKTRNSVAQNSFFISTIYTGGTLLVLPMRLIEDHKASLVRKLDHWWHGNNADDDPNLQAAHQAMDKAPKQSLFSLLSARLLALPVGLALGPLLGDAHALSTKLTTAKPFAHYSSFTRAGLTISRNVAAHFFPKLRDAALEAKRLSPYAEMPHEHRGIKVGFYVAYDLLLSAVVATGFYASSKIFAKLFSDHAQRKPQNDASDEAPTDYITYIAADNARPAPQASTSAAAPLTHVSSARLADAAAPRRSDDIIAQR